MVNPLLQVWLCYILQIKPFHKLDQLTKPFEFLIMACSLAVLDGDLSPFVIKLLARWLFWMVICLPLSSNCDMYSKELQSYG